MTVVQCMKCSKLLLVLPSNYLGGDPVENIINVVCEECFNGFEKLFEELSSDIYNLKSLVSQT